MNREDTITVTLVNGHKEHLIGPFKVVTLTEHVYAVDCGDGRPEWVFPLANIQSIYVLPKGAGK